MEIVVWLFWALLSALSLLWSLVWFLISGWVSTLLQIAVLIAVVYWLKYGWQRAPVEIWVRSRTFGRFFWNWIRAGEATAGPRTEEREVVRVVRASDLGDVNVSTLLSLLLLLGLMLMAGA